MSNDFGPRGEVVYLIQRFEMLVCFGPFRLNGIFYLNKIIKIHELNIFYMNIYLIILQNKRFRSLPAISI